MNRKDDLCVYLLEKHVCFIFAQCTVREENGKLVSESPKFTSVREIQGDDMVDVSGFHSL